MTAKQLKTESTRKLSICNFQWTKTLYQNNLKNIAFFFTFFKGYICILVICNNTKENFSSEHEKMNVHFLKKKTKTKNKKQKTKKQKNFSSEHEKMNVHFFEKKKQKNKKKTKQKKFLIGARENECPFHKITSHIWNFQNFTCVFTILVKFDIHFLGLAWKIFFGVITDD